MARAEPIPCKELRGSSGSPMRVQGLKALGHLVSQAAKRELDGKCNSRDTDLCPYGMSANTWGGFSY